MSLETIIEMAFFAVFTGGLGTLFWARLNRLEAQIIDIRRTMATREDLAQSRAEGRNDLAQFRKEVRNDFAQIRTEMSAIRHEIAVLRSDLTQVALAVGVNRPKPAEG
jgi:hypothetical protein